MVFEVLAEPKRRLILDLLREKELPVNELVDALAVSQPAVSKHLRVLRDAGFVESRVDAQRRLYKVRAEPLREVDEWIAPYRAMWASSLSALEEHLEQMDDATGDATTGGTRRTPHGARPRPVRRDREGG